MYTNKSIHLHSKCLAILDMIQRVNNRLADEKSKLKIYNNNVEQKRFFSMLNILNTAEGIQAEINHQTKLKERLVRSYANTVENLIEPILNTMVWTT